MVKMNVGSGMIFAILQGESVRNLLFGFSIIFVWIKARVEAQPPLGHTPSCIRCFQLRAQLEFSTGGLLPPLLHTEMPIDVQIGTENLWTQGLLGLHNLSRA